MSDEIRGMKELLQELEKLDNRVKNKTISTAIESASEVMLDSIKKTAPRAETNSKRSYTFLNKRITKRGGTVKAKMGINGDNWERTKGLTYSPFIQQCISNNSFNSREILL